MSDGEKLINAGVCINQPASDSALSAKYHRMTLLSTASHLPGAEQQCLVSIHRAFLVKVLARITRGLVVNILPGSLAEAGSWQLSCDMRTQVQSHNVTKFSAWK